MAQRVPVGEEVERLCSYLTSLSLNVTRDWLTGCVEYYRDIHSQYSTSELQEFVKKQWELSDLRDSSGGSLPHNLQTQIKITLRGKYAVQIESVINISQPAYGQIQKIRRVDVGNVEATEKKQESWEPRPGRMLKLKLCDGQRNAEAIEYRPLQMLNEQIIPGTKILIIGPVDCRRGLFFLKPENVKLIGGEVDSLLVVNHWENVLARALGLPENQEPFSSNSAAPSTQTLDTSISETQRSTYTPSIAATPTAVNGVSGRQNNIHSTVRNTRAQQRQPLIQEAFRNRSSQDSAIEVLNDSLNGTGWTVDDLLAEGEEAFIDLSEERPKECDDSVPLDKSCSNYLPNYTLENIHNVSSSVGKNSVFKVPQLPAKSNPEQRSKKSSNCNSKNPFLACDEYIDSLNMDEWEDEEISEFVNAPPRSTNSVGNSINKQMSVGASNSNTLQTNSNQNEPQDSKSTNVANSFEMPTIQPKPFSAGQLNFPHKQIPKTSNQQFHKNIPLPSSPDTFGNEEDWADAYLNSQNISFINKYESVKSASKSPLNPVKFSPPLVIGESKSSLMRDVNISKSTSEVPVTRTLCEGNVCGGDRISFLESRTHLQPSFSSPTHIYEDSNITPRSAETASSSSSNVQNKRQSPKSSVNTGMVPVKKKSAYSTYSAKVFEDAKSALNSPIPFVYLVQIVQSPTKMNGTHRIKGTIVSLLSQLKVDPSAGWCLSVKLCDGTAMLDVQFASEVLDEIIGLSAQEFRKMRKDFSSNPLLKDKIIKMLERTRELLINLNCFFDIKFEMDQIQVVKISEISVQDVYKLRLRLNDT